MNNLKKRESIYDDLNTSRSRGILRSRSHVFAQIRQILSDMGFIEVDTPILYPYRDVVPMEQFEVTDPTSRRIYYMRIAPTEHLKRMMVAGFTKVYEFSRNFRPGNTSYKHSAEFTSLECSQISADYNTMMELTERIISEVILERTGETSVDVGGRTYNVQPPWDRITVRDALRRYAHIDILGINSLEDLYRQRKEIDQRQFSSLNDAVEHFIENEVLPKIESPTFLTEFPDFLGGPAKQVEGHPKLKQRCEAFIGSFEIANMSSHMNDIDQLRFLYKQTLALKTTVVPNAEPLLDEPLLEFLGHGLPDSAIVGIGIDRLVMLSTNVRNIQSVIPFPFEMM